MGSKSKGVSENTFTQMHVLYIPGHWLLFSLCCLWDKMKAWGTCNKWMEINVSLKLIILSFVLFYPYYLTRETLVYDRWLARIAGSNPARGMDVASCESSVVSGRDLCDGPITLLEDFYRMRCVWVWSRKLSNEEAWTQWGCRAIRKISQTRGEL